MNLTKKKKIINQGWALIEHILFSLKEREKDLGRLKAEYKFP